MALIQVPIKSDFLPIPDALTETCGSMIMMIIITVAYLTSVEVVT